MPKYRVKIERTTVEAAWIEIEADFEAHAIELVEDGPDYDASSEHAVNVAYANAEGTWQFENTVYEVDEFEGVEEI